MINPKPWKCNATINKQMEAAENKRKKWNWRGHQNEEERMEIEDKWAGSKLLVKGPKNAGEEAMYTTNRSKPSKLETPKLNTQQHTKLRGIKPSQLPIIIKWSKNQENGQMSTPQSWAF